MTASLPAVGDVFESIKHFKLACHRGALPAGVEMSSPQSDDRRATMACRLRSDSTLRKIGRGDLCTFRIRGQDKGGEFCVTDACYTHSCDAELRRKRRELAELWCEEKIEQLEAPNFARRGTRAAASSLWTDPPSDENEEDEDYAEEEEGEEVGPSERKSAKRALKRMRRDRPSRRNNDAHSSDDDSSFSSSSLSSSHSVAPTYPSAHDLKQEINALASAGRVSFPSSTTFANVRDLFIHLHAYAQQRNFALYRYSDSAKSHYVKIVCTRGHYRYTNATKGRCGMFLEAEKGEDGEWRVTDKSRKHNHDLEATTAVSTPSSNEKKPKLATRSRQTSPSGPPAPSASVPASPLSHLQRAAALQPPPRESPHLPLAAPSSPPSDLSAFLLAFFPSTPPHSLSALVSLFLLIGISSQDDLVALLLAEKSTVNLFIQELEGEGVPPEQCLRMLVMVKTMGAEMA